MDDDTKIIDDNENILFSDNETSKEFETPEETIDEANIENAFSADTEDFSEVLQLTQYNDNMLTANNDSFVVAEYHDIKVPEIQQKHQVIAKKFVAKITKFVLDFNDVVLSEEHKTYLKQVGNLQVQHLEDLLSLTDINKQMLSNIVARVNATQAEDYAIINSYNNLVNQHLKLIKELQNTYRNIPNVLKKMRADILCNQELDDNNTNGDEVVTEDYGKTQFNNTKQMMKTILDNYDKKDKKE